FHEMFDPACAAAEVELQIGAHDSPAESRPPAHRIIGVGDTQHVLLNEIHDLFVESGLEAVRGMAGNFLAQKDGLLSDRLIKCHRLRDGGGRCLRATHDFDQWNDVRRVEGMPDQATLSSSGSMSSKQLSN